MPEKVVVWGDDSAPLIEAWSEPDGEWRWRRLGDRATHVHLASCADALGDIARHMAMVTS